MGYRTESPPRLVTYTLVTVLVLSERLEAVGIFSRPLSSILAE
jgi:hypothetical protein